MMRAIPSSKFYTAASIKITNDALLIFAEADRLFMELIDHSTLVIIDFLHRK